MTINRPVYYDIYEKHVYNLLDIAEGGKRIGVDAAKLAMLVALKELAGVVAAQPAADIIEEHRHLDDVVRRIERVLEAHDSDVFADFAAGNIELPTAIDAVIDSYKSALAAVGADAQRSNARLEQLNRINAWIISYAGDAYDDTTDDDDTADAIIAVADTLRGQVAKLREELRITGAEAAQFYADNARLTEELRTVRSWSVAPTGNGKTRAVAEMLAEVDAEQTADGKVSVWAQPGMLDFLDAETRDYWVGITAGRWTWRKLPKRTRLAMLRHVLSFGPDPGDMTQAQFDAMKPSWMPPGSSHPGSFGVSWSQLNDARVEVTV